MRGRAQEPWKLEPQLGKWYWRVPSDVPGIKMNFKINNYRDREI